ncbi:hypothetical protein IFM89_012529 [Coptis chinensis]|uniref:NAC domain-containing protein n=1 Tax=Coptis chinensis TaxID=261450 RepID=A0A835LMU2_9MAGN|nr:hypothetical protein IFM89_012529 [Coptis chinensis]
MFRLGYRFLPTEEELIKYLEEAYEGGGLHGIMKNKKSDHGGGTNIDRTVGAKGKWKMQGRGRTKGGVRDAAIYDPQDKSLIIGYMKTLNFYGNDESKKDISWIMHEYTLSVYPPGQQVWALCNIEIRNGYGVPNGTASYGASRSSINIPSNFHDFLSISEAPDGSLYAQNNYRGGVMEKMRNVDGDRINFMDLEDDMKENYLFDISVGFEILYTLNGEKVYVKNDNDLMQMWANMEEDIRRWNHVFVELEGELIELVETMVAPTPQVTTPKCRKPIKNVKKKSTRRRIITKNKSIIKDNDDFYSKKCLCTLDDFDEKDDWNEDLPPIAPLSSGPQADLLPPLPPINLAPQADISPPPPHTTNASTPHISGTDNIIDIDEGSEQSVNTPLIWEVEMEWPNIDVLRDDIKDFCIGNRFADDLIKNDPLRIRVVCLGEDRKKVQCPCVAYFGRDKDGFTMKLNTLKPIHTCQTDCDMLNRMANANWVVRKIQEQMKVN